MRKLKLRRSPTLKDNLKSIFRSIMEKFREVVAIFICTVLIIFLNSENTVSEYIQSRALGSISVVYKYIDIPLTSIQSAYHGFKQYLTTTEENKLLAAENERLKSEIASMELERAYSRSLEKLLNVAGKEDSNFITAKILTKNFDNFQMTFSINAGASDGIQNNSFVLNSQGLIGRVIKTHKESALVMTIMDPRSNVPVLFLDSKEEGMIVGSQMRNNMWEPKYIKHSNNIIDKENVITSGIGGIFDFGLYIGKAKIIDNKVYIESPISWSLLDYVVVFPPKEAAADSGIGRG